MKEGTAMTSVSTPRATTEEGRRVWTVEAIRRLGATTDIETAGAILGVGRTKAYELAKGGEFPVRVLRVGRRYLVSVPAILQVLGVE